jgi:hypothetical protein
MTGMASTLAFLLVRDLFRLVGLGPTADDKEFGIAVLHRQVAAPATH